MVGALSFVCIFRVLFCFCIVLLAQNVNYSLNTSAFVLLLYTYSVQVAPSNVTTFNHFCIKNAQFES